jgi:hypothetical protein
MLISIRNYSRPSIIRISCGGIIRINEGKDSPERPEKKWKTDDGIS